MSQKPQPLHLTPYVTFARDKSLGTSGGYNTCDRTDCYRYKIPLHEAVKGANLDEVKQLIASGEDINESDFGGTTALSLAILSSQTKMIDILIQHGVNPNTSRKLIRDLIKKDDIKTIERLLDIGANVDGIKDTVWPDEIPLLEAIQNKKVAIALMLIKRGANVNIEPERRDKDYHTALALAAYDTKLTPVVKALLEAGADPNKKAILDITPLHCAAETNNIEAIKLLIHKGADVNAVDHTGFTPAFKVFSQYREDKKNELNALKILIANGVNVDSTFKCLDQSGWQSNSGDTLLHFAIRSGTLESVKYIISLKANPSTKNDKGNTPLHYAVASDFRNVTKLLINSGAELNVQNNNGDTPMHYATYSGNVFLAELLLKAGANPRIKNKSGRDSINVALNTSVSGDTTKIDLFKKLFARYKLIE